MEVEYKKDLHQNYMVITGMNYNSMEEHSIKMLCHQRVDGILPMERRNIDNKILFYYDITAKQSLNNFLEKSILSFDQIKHLLLHMIDTIERAYEYLLIEDDFILTPEYIYMDVTKETPILCYLSGYRKNSKDQMSSFIEFLMNKVDYNDKEGVLLIYRLYAISKEEGFTFYHILEVLKEHNLTLQEQKMKGFNNSVIVEKREGKPIIPVMMEKLEGEEEVLYYPLKVYLFTGACILGGAFLILMSILTKITYNTFGNRIDFIKLFALLLLTICVEGYILSKIWDKKNRITKIITKQEYIDPRLDKEKINLEPFLKVENRNGIRQQKDNDNTLKGSMNEQSFDQAKAYWNAQESVKISVQTKSTVDEKYDNPTCLLNEVSKQPEFILKPVEESKYESITINEVPFFIGKLKKKVDYCLEKDVVSRYHAKITKEQDHYYVTDLNSTNGTFLNEEPLKTYQKKEIKVGDEIAFANIKYIVTN